MHIDSETRVRDVATAAPASLRLFERWGIDYCCGGGRTLRESCAKAGLVLPDVVRELRAVVDAKPDDSVTDWTKRTPEALIDHLLATHHEFTRTELVRAMALATKVRRVHGSLHPELHELADLVEAMRDDLLPHMEKEERVLFPWIRRDGGAAEPGTFGRFPISVPIRCMEDEHEALGEILQRVRVLTGGFVPPLDACGSFRALYGCLADLDADLRLHIHLENDVLFPAALVRATRPVEGGTGATRP